MTDKKLHQMFTQIGQIEACRVMKDVKVSLSKFVVVRFYFTCYRGPSSRVRVGVDGGNLYEKDLNKSRRLFPP